MILLTNQNRFAVFKHYCPNPSVIVEAGAFNGKDTIALSNHFPTASIHAFEPVPEIFNTLSQNTNHYKNVLCHQLALSDKDGKATFFVATHPKKNDKQCQAGSLLVPKERLKVSPIVYTTTITVPTITLDRWAELNSVSQVDFLWLDLQGHELAVLQASKKVLPSVVLLYIEVNFIQAYEQQASYSDTNAWLAMQGFLPIAKDFVQETHFFGNVLYHQRK